MKASPHQTANEGQASRNHKYPESVDHAARRRICHFIPVLLLFLSGQARATIPVPPGTNMFLCSWSFNGDTNTWYNDNGYAPLSFTNITSSTLGIGPGALVMDSTNPAWLAYNVNEADATSNLTLQVGTVMMWLAPNWTSTNQGGTGPGQSARLVEVGTYTTNASYGWWSLYTDDVGANLYFTAQDEWGDEVTFLTAPISWGTTNAWHHIALTYSSTNTSLYLEGSLVTNGSPLNIWPNPSVQANGFTIGSDRASGVAQIHGIIDEVSTYNFEVDAGTIGGNYLNGQMALLMNPMNLASISSVSYTQSTTVTMEGIAGGNLVQGDQVTNCISGDANSVWITNAVAALTTTNTVNFTFSIAGGVDNMAYDVFANAILGPTNSTAFQWAWVGQARHCYNYTIPNLPPYTAYVRLGTPLDSDADGLPDAFERLVSHSNPYSPSTSGDGISDLYKLLHGLSLTNMVAVPALSAITIPTCPIQ